MRIKPTSAYEDIHMHFLVFEYLLPSSSLQPSFTLCFLKSSLNVSQAMNVVAGRQLHSGS
jgi:hypothetical protein